MSHRASVILAVVAICAWGLAGCTQDVVYPEDSVTVDAATCTKTECDLVAETPMTACKECRHECSQHFCSDPDTECATQCRKPSCDPTKCVEHEWTGHVQSLRPTPGVEDFCVEAYSLRNERCGRDTPTTEAQTRDVCAHDARINTIASLEMYACFSDVVCGGDSGYCESSRSTLGDDLCQSIDESCPTYCADDVREGLNTIGYRLKPVLLDAAKTCAAQSTCGDISACMQAWWKLL